MRYNVTQDRAILLDRTLADRIDLRYSTMSLYDVVHGVFMLVVMRGPVIVTVGKRSTSPSGSSLGLSG
jgi:hypothetical protein